MEFVDVDTLVKRAVVPYFRNDEIVTRLDTIAGLDWYIVKIYRDDREIGGLQFSKHMLDRNADYVAQGITNQTRELERAISRQPAAGSPGTRARRRGVV